MLDKEKVMDVVSQMTEEEIVSMIKSTLHCPSRFRLNDSNCDFVDCITCWRRALRATVHTKDIIK